MAPIKRFIATLTISIAAPALAACSPARRLIAITAINNSNSVFIGSMALLMDSIGRMASICKAVITNNRLDAIPIRTINEPGLGLTTPRANASKDIAAISSMTRNTFFVNVSGSQVSRNLNARTMRLSATPIPTNNPAAFMQVPAGPLDFVIATARTPSAITKDIIMPHFTTYVSESILIALKAITIAPTAAAKPSNVNIMFGLISTLSHEFILLTKYDNATRAPANTSIEPTAIAIFLGSSIVHSKYIEVARAAIAAAI